MLKNINENIKAKSPISKNMNLPHSPSIQMNYIIPNQNNQFVVNQNINSNFN